MIKIGITGSIASGKTTASKILAKKKGPLFSADNIVKVLYSKKDFKRSLSKNLKIDLKKNLKKEIKKKVLDNYLNLRKLEKIIHPYVRRKMISFLKKNKSKKFLFLEIPLLIESKLMNYFDVIIFIKSKKLFRLKRYLSRGGNKKLFFVLNNHQLKDFKKAKHCDHIVVNNKSLSVLKNNLLNIIKTYERDIS